MNDLIESIVPWAKFAHHEEIYKWYAYCVDKLNDTWLQSHKISLAPTSGRVLSKFLQTLRAMSWTCPKSLVLIDLC